MHSLIAAASSRGVTLGICSLPENDSEKIGRTRSVQSGQIAGAEASRLADKMPVTNVPWRHAVLLA